VAQTCNGRSNHTQLSRAEVSPLALRPHLTSASCLVTRLGPRQLGNARFSSCSNLNSPKLNVHGFLKRTEKGRVVMLMKWMPFMAASVVCLAGLAHAGCPVGDVTGDCQVDVADLQILAGQWLAEPNSIADINGDLRVDMADLALLANSWGETSRPIVINELLAHSHDIAPDWIELYNTSRIPVDISGWYLSDDQKDPCEYRIADGTVVGPHGYVVFYQDLQFGNPADPGTLVPFALSENGETLSLYSGDDKEFPRYLEEETFGASERWISFGRHRKSTGDSDFVLMSESTPGSTNAYPRVGPVVINEIMYHPDGSADAEYIELLNISEAPVTLYDANAAEPWRLMDPNLWFPTDPPVTLQPRECLVLAKDPSAFSSSYAVPLGTQVLQWSSGKLANGGEELVLAKPGDVDNQGTRYWIQVDTVQYSDGSHDGRFPGGSDPWPHRADGSGEALSRRYGDRYGNDPNNWKTAMPSPGQPND